MSSSDPICDIGDTATRRSARSGLRGWLLVYTVGLVMQALHGLVLTVGAIVIFADPQRAGPISVVPLGALFFYVITNIAVALYTAIVLVLMVRRRKAAIVNGVVLNCVAVLFLISWHLLGEKSPFGATVDSIPGLLGLAYILCSKRARNTLFLPQDGTPLPISTGSR